MLTGSQVQLLQQKITRLQADNIIYEQQVTRLRRRIIDLEQYRIKYELLLEKNTQESPLYISRRVDEINNMNKKIQESNEKWASKLRIIQKKYDEKLKDLEEKNFELTQQLENKKSIDTSKVQINQTQLNNLRAENATLRSTNKQLVSKLQQLQDQLRTTQSLNQQTEQMIEQAKRQQKQFYRQKIQQLESQIQKLNEQVQYHRIRSSPQRQLQIVRLEEEIKRKEKSHDDEIRKFSELIRKKQLQVEEVNSILNISKKQSYESNQLLQQQLQNARQSLFEKQQQHHMQLMACRKDMQQFRRQQVQLLKQSFDSLQNNFESQRQQWQLILQQQQQQLNRIKGMWQEEKQKYIEEKNKLKAKIDELRQKIKRTSEQQKKDIDNQTFKLLQSLKIIDDEENKMIDYENSVVFLHRQLKRSTAKIDEKQREVDKLLKELEDQRLEFEQQKQFIKKLQRSQSQYYKQKLMQADQQNTKLLQQIRDKQKYLRAREEQQKSIFTKLQQQNFSLKTIMEQMQRDYRRLTENKKQLYQSYRSERDLVFTGKTELNQERKNNYVVLARQKHELEIAYKEREKQIKNQYELIVAQLKDKLAKANQEKEVKSAEVEILREKVNESDIPTKKNKEEALKDFHKKIATLDLQISLTQNLFSTLKSVKARTSRKGEIDQLSGKQSQQSLPYQQSNNNDSENDEDEVEVDVNKPNFVRGVQNQEKDPYEELQNFSFVPESFKAKFTKIQRKKQDEISFSPRIEVSDSQDEEQRQ